MAWGSCKFKQNGGAGGETRTLYFQYTLIGTNQYQIIYWATAQNTSLSFRITECNTPVKSGSVFSGYLDGNGRYLANRLGTLTTGIEVSSNSLNATANWQNDSYGLLIDYYNLATPGGPLTLVSATSGETRSPVETTGTSGSGSNLRSGILAIQTANSSVGGFVAGTILMRPTCTYRIIRPGDVTINLGKAYGGATISGSGTTANPYRIEKSGFMLTSAEYATAADGEPLLVVRGAANEGFAQTSTTGNQIKSCLTDAINLWPVQLHVSPYHIAQDPYNAVVGGGELLECKTLITCDPVVPMEDGHPCASDVVRGKIVVTATVNAYSGEAAPTAGSPYIETNGVPISEHDVDYVSYAFAAERSL